MEEAAEYDDSEAVRWAEKSEYPKLWLTYTHWALGMRSLARNDYATARDHFQRVVRQRVIYTGQYLWARSLLANWKALVDNRKT